MKTDWTHLEPFRKSPPGYESNAGDPFGWFIWIKDHTQLRAMAVNGTETGWEHVRVTVAYLSNKTWVKRIPKWEEMCWIKAQFWQPEECVVEFHPPESTYVNIATNCLHLWRCTSEKFPTPPEILV